MTYKLPNLLFKFFQLFILFQILLSGSYVVAQDETVRTPEEILSGIENSPSAEAITELFINCSEWDEVHAEVQDSSRDALIELGVDVVPTILENWLHSVDLRRRIELDNIIRAIGHPCAELLIPYLDSSDNYTRRHTGYLLGDTAAIQAVDDPSLPGPLDEDLPAVRALRNALAVESDWHASRQMLSGLGMMRDPDQIEFIASWLNDEEQAVRLSAAIALGRIPHQDIVQHLILAFNDPVTTVRQASVLALSTETNGNLAFEALIGTTLYSPTGPVASLCSLEALYKYLDVISNDHSDRANSQRGRAFDTAVAVYRVVPQGRWEFRAYAVTLIGYTYDPEAESTLLTYLETEEHPFVIGKINEALDRLEEGLPEEVIEE